MNETKVYKPTVVFDFDGVIHEYSTKWSGATNISDQPVDGIREAISEIREQFNVIVVSSRTATPEGREAVSKWLEEHNIVVDSLSCEKPPAHVYIDDRAITFDGNPSTLLHKIKSFRPWNK